VHWAPGIPHALRFEGEDFWQTSDESRRENAKVCSSLRGAQATKQSTLSCFLPCCAMDCFAALAMTVWHEGRATFSIVITREGG
jgi:hypothetical protein